MASLNSRIQTMGKGIWIVGAGKSALLSPAAKTSFLEARPQGVPIRVDQGLYFWSEDGFDWFPSFGEDNTRLNDGWTFSGYANGMFIGGGQDIANGFNDLAVLISATDPRQTTKNISPWAVRNFLPAQDTYPTAKILPTYDNTTNKFSVAIMGGTVADGLGDYITNLDVQNTLPKAIVPDPVWPYIGQDSVGTGGTSVFGMGTQGYIEVRIQTAVGLDLFGNQFNTDYLVAKKVGVDSDFLNVGISQSLLGDFSDRQPLLENIPPDFDLTLPPISNNVVYPSIGLDYLSGSSVRRNPINTGLVLKGLVWGPIKETAVQFKGGTI